MALRREREGAEAAQRGQASIEWIGLVALAALLLTAMLWASGALRIGTALPKSVLERMVCAVRLSGDCRFEPELRRDYGEELAAAVRAHAPALLYEKGMRALPVDYRRCRADACAEGRPDGALARSDAGEPVVAFTHAIDCREGAAAESERRGANCSGARAGHLYLQYWFYYPGSATAEGSTPLKGAIRAGSAAIGHPTHHEDDWESYQVRIGPDGRFARASSHHWYTYELGGGGPIPGHRLIRRDDGSLGLKRRPEVVNGWGPEVGTLHVSGGSHAGSARVERLVTRTTKDGRLTLVPLTSPAASDATSFAVTPPWRKRVFFDPEYAGTD